MAHLLATQLELQRCPHCNVDSPSLRHIASMEPTSSFGVKKYWRAYACGRCAGIVCATASGWDHEVFETYPASRGSSDDLPPRAKAYLEQAINSLSSPAGAVMLAASAVDAMLKAKALTEVLSQ